ncbi:MAG: PspC domain-containing protein [Marinifilaceae bacterium]|jgi:phage shock protein C|nr:PspC domain-containing protein [Marinifilaceae bacterium]
MSRKLRRSSNKMIAGVCSGIAEFLGWETSTLRIIVVLLAIFTAALPCILAYIILWFVMPDYYDIIK